MRCILEALPPDAIVTGYVGDRGSYYKFEAPVREARAAALEASAKWLACKSEIHRNVIGSGHETRYFSCGYRISFDNGEETHHDGSCPTATRKTRNAETRERVRRGTYPWNKAAA